MKKRPKVALSAAGAMTADAAESRAIEYKSGRQANEDWMSADEALRVTRAQLWRLSAQHLTMQEGERKRLALELHEGLGQVLVLVKQSIEDAASSMDAGASVKIGDTLKLLSSQVNSALDDLRRISMNLRPATLDQLGIVATLSWFLREFELARPNMQLERLIGVQEAEVPEALKIAIFRIVQEAVGNILRHADADWVKLSLTSMEGMLNLCIEDNGRGFDTSKARGRRDIKHGTGLQSMRERAELSGGTYEFQSAPAQGTRIDVWWPQLEAAAPECPVLPMKRILARQLCGSAPDRELPDRFSHCLTCMRRSGTCAPGGTCTSH